MKILAVWAATMLVNAVSFGLLVAPALVIRGNPGFVLAILIPEFLAVMWLRRRWHNQVMRPWARRMLAKYEIHTRRDTRKRALKYSRRLEKHLYSVDRSREIDGNL